MRTFWLARVVTFATLILFSIIVLGLSAFYVSKSTGHIGDFSFSSPSWANLALATSILTLVALGPMLALDFFLRAHTSLILVELIVLGILAVLWLASGADAAAFTNGVVPDCSDLGVVVGLVVVRDNTLISLCRSYQAVEAFSWINWLILMGYIITLLVFAIIAGTRGNSVWMGTVRETDFQGGKMSNGIPMNQQSFESRPAVQNHYTPSPAPQSMYSGSPGMQNGHLPAQV